MRRRILTYLAVAALSLLLLVPAWLAGTSSGLRQLLQVAESRLPLEIEAPAGSLWGGLQFASLSYRSESLLLSIENASLEFRWACALRSMLCLDSGRISALSVELRGEPDADSKPLAAPLPWSPIAVNVGKLELAELAVITAGDSTTFSALVLSGELDMRRALLERLDGRQQFGSWEGGALLSRDGTWEMEFTLQPNPGELAEIALQLPERLSLSATGDLSQLGANLRGLPDSQAALQPVLQPALQLTLALPSDDAPLRASGSLSGLTSLLPQLASQDRVSVAGPLLFDIRQPAAGATIALRQRVGGFAPEPLWLDVELVQREEQWELTRGTLGAKSQPTLSAQGMLGVQNGLAPRLQILLRDFTPPLGSELPALTISGSLVAALALDDPLGSWAVEDLDVAVLEQQGERFSDWLLQGELQASDQLLLPRGQLQGRRDALPFSYERPDGTAAVAWLRLPEGLPGDGVEITALSARIAPGTQTVLSLRSEGDIRGDLDLRLQADDRGVVFELEPFVFYALDQAISSDGPVAGAWLRDESLLQLGEFCINWRGSKACADGAKLGESGDLDLAVTLDEQYQAAAAGKPYFLEAAGSGRLNLRWADAALEEALLKLDLDTLSVDPFMEEGTAAPISWETARISGSFQPDSLGLDLALESERLGSIEATLRENAEGLAGNVRAQGVNLSALDDLLPELSLRSGAVQADLQLSGVRSAPIVNGTLIVDGASARLPQLDSALSAVNVRVDASNERYTLGGSARLGDGPLNIQGVCCDDGVLRAAINGERNRLRLPVGLDALVSPELDIQLGRQSLAVDGLITVHDGVLEHSGPSEGGVPLSNDVRRLDTPEAPPQRFDFSADVRALIEPGFTLRSRELEATLSGDLRASLRPERPPALFGDLQVLGGELRAYGQLLRLTQGSVGFVGDPLNPALNLSAERRIRAEDLRVGFNVRGTLETPTFDIFSDPVRSERDTLSYLLRGRGPDAGTSLDGTAMALSLGASAINQSGALESLNSIPGLSGVTLGAEGSDEDMAATISAYVGERLYLSYGVGIYEPVNALTARLYLQSRLWLEVVSRLESSFDLYYRFDIE